jgi:hypothetical protein
VKISFEAWHNPLPQHSNVQQTATKFRLHLLAGQQEQNHVEIRETQVLVERHYKVTKFKMTVERRR